VRESRGKEWGIDIAIPMCCTSVHNPNETESLKIPNRSTEAVNLRMTRVNLFTGMK
jgi:hypothetical protein